MAALNKIDLMNFPYKPAHPVIKEYLKSYALLNAKTVAATTTGAAVALLYPGQSTIHVKVQSGDVSGTSPTLDIVIQESADGSSGWATIMTIPQLTAADQVYLMEVQKSKPYIRFVATLGGTSTPKVNANIIVLE